MEADLRLRTSHDFYLRGRINFGYVTMNHPPLEIFPNMKIEDNEYLCSDLRESAQYVNSFHVYFTLTTNVTKERKSELVESIFSPLFHSVKEMTAFFDDCSVVSADDFQENWSVHKDRMKAKKPVKCKEDFSKLWFNSKVSFILNKDKFNAPRFFSQCCDPGVLLNPRTGHGKSMWNYMRYRVDKHDLMAICTDHHNVSDQSNASLRRPAISIVAKGSNLRSLLSDCFKYCSVTNRFPTKNGKLFHVRIGRIKVNESHFRKRGMNLDDGYGDLVVKKLRSALRDKGLLINLYPWPGCIEFDYEPETWDEYVSVVRKELRDLNVPESTIIVSNSHPCTTLEYSVYDD